MLQTTGNLSVQRMLKNKAKQAKKARDAKKAHEAKKVQEATKKAAEKKKFKSNYKSTYYKEDRYIPEPLTQNPYEDTDIVTNEIIKDKSNIKKVQFMEKISDEEEIANESDRQTDEVIENTKKNTKIEVENYDKNESINVQNNNKEINSADKSSIKMKEKKGNNSCCFVY